MRLAVTGAAGFIGSRLSEALVAEGHRVVGIDDVSGPCGGGGLARLATTPAFSLDRLDVSADALAGGLHGAEAVLHLAGLTGVRGTATPLAYLNANAGGTARVLDAARRVGVRRVLLASSSSVYAPSAGPTAEDAPLGPASPYGASKLAAERVCAGAGIDVVAVRYFTVYGPGQRPDMAFARFLEALTNGRPVPLLGDGDQVRDFTYVDDAVEGTLRALRCGRPGVAYNLSGGRPVSVRSALATAVGRPAVVARHPPHPHEARRTHACLRRARGELGYAPALELEEGLRRQAADGAAPVARAS